MVRWLPAVALLGGLLLVSQSAGASTYPTGKPSVGGRGALEETLGLLGTPDGWRTFLTAVAYRESRFSLAAENTTSGEAAAAARAYRYSRERGRLASSPWPASAYSWGSGGWYGMLPAYAMAAWHGTDLENLDPRAAVHDPIVASIMALEYARRIQGWATFDGTWLGLRVGWSNPSLMGNPEFVAKVRARFASDLEALGIAPSWMNRRIQSMTGYPGALELYNATHRRANA